MTEEEKLIEKKILPWRFWLSTVLSAFFVVTFVYYFPLRFFHHATADEENMPHDTMSEEGHMDEHNGAAYHEEDGVKEGLVVNVSFIEPLHIGEPTFLDFFVNEKPDSVPVFFDKLEIEHTKLMHVIGVREDMNEFFHIHPDPFTQRESDIMKIGPGGFSSEYMFSQPGKYKIWSQVTKDGTTHTYGHAPFVVEGEGERSHKEVSFERNVFAGDYQVALKTDEPFVKGKTQELSFDIHSPSGEEIEVEQYLGADMHLVIIKDDWTQVVHTHPESGDSDHGHAGFGAMPTAFANGAHDEGMAADSDKAINFHVVFPEVGLYRAYAQFRPKGTDILPDDALTAMFWFRVEDNALLPISPRWILFFISAIMIVVLSAGVKNFLQAK